jgi:Dna[CI] antecedent DciA-like protein
MHHSKDMERVSGGLSKVLGNSLKQAPVDEAPVLAWPLVCGTAVAERTHAVAFAKGVLYVQVPDHGWRHELATLAPRYVALINGYVPEDVTRIEFVVSGR